MNIPQLRIDSQLGQISMQTIPGRQTLQQPKADLSIQQPLGNLSMQTRKGQLQIDQTKAWEDMNLHSPLRNRDLFYGKSFDLLRQAATRLAQEGNELMKIENGGSPIVAHAKQRSERPEKSLGIEFIPSPFSVEINYTPADLHLQYQPNAPQIHASVNKPIHIYEQGRVDIGMKQDPELHIDFVY